MNIRTAQKKDTASILHLLSQVLEIHAALKPELFISGTTKYTEAELAAIFADSSRRTYVAEDESGQVVGYAFCQLIEYRNLNHIVPHTELYIDDLCVDSSARGKGIGKALFAYVKEQAKAMGCLDITLNVWEGNTGAKAFYEAMGMQPKETKMECILK
ncbi:MAG: GNAT family N-acetyltransferase [Clostridia bacterium]|nr:GNAT family N-acetyltransferase [Clostridia bacterium]